MDTCLEQQSSVQPRSEDKGLNLMRLVVSGLLVAVAVTCSLAQLSNPVSSIAVRPATWTSPITITNSVQTISPVTTDGYVVMVVVTQDAQGHTVTQTLWTMSTIGRSKSTEEPASTAIVVLAAFGMVVVSTILLWGRRCHAGTHSNPPMRIMSKSRPSQLKMHSY